MRTKNFIELKKCSKTLPFRYMEAEDQSAILTHTCLCDIMADCYAVTKGEEVTEGHFLMIRERAQAEVDLTKSRFKEEWFGGGQVQLQTKRELLQNFFDRFMEWFLPRYIYGATIIGANVPCTLGLSDDETGQVYSLDDSVSLILKIGDCYHALILNSGKNNEKRSMNGRSDSTRIQSDLRYNVIKCALEETYPGITLDVVFFQEGESKGQMQPWVVSGTSKSNVFSLEYEDCYEQGEFAPDLCLNKGDRSLKEYAAKKQSAKCDACVHKQECQMQTMSQRKPARLEKGNWQLPEYDEQQQAFINHHYGEVIVCAGPGSGKTSALTGRAVAMANGGIPSEQMLMVGYTEKAVGEMRTRLLGKFPKDEMPKICTLHSLAADIDHLSANLYKRKPHRPLTKAAEKELIRQVLETNRGKLTGVEYRNFLRGKYSTVSTVATALRNYSSDKEKFLFKNPLYVEREWEYLKKEVERIAAEEGYITYDEMITNAVHILKTEKNVAEYFHKKFQYVMVDEYQDIKAEEEELITLLEGDNKNLACIGDDDQSIYAFKGCSSKYMLQFQNRHPNSRVILMGTNYRSTKKIVELSNYLLSNMEAGKRISKTIKYPNFAAEGKAPRLIADNSIETVDTLVSEAAANGFRYDEIAVIATKNATLQTLHDCMKVPTELASAFITNDFLFNVVLNSLAVVLKADETINPLVRLGIIFERDEEWFKKLKGGELEESDPVMKMISFCNELLGEDPKHYVARLSAKLDMDESMSEKAMLDIAGNVVSDSLSEFYGELSDMVLYGEDKKIEYPIEGKVTLITAHSCKGKEWPVVIVYDTDSFVDTISEDGKESMDARLFYVSASRAKRELYFLKTAGSKSIIDDCNLVEKQLPPAA